MPYKIVNTPKLVSSNPDQPTFAAPDGTLVITFGRDFMVTLNREDALALGRFISRHVDGTAGLWLYGATGKSTQSGNACYALEC